MCTVGSLFPRQAPLVPDFVEHAAFTATTTAFTRSSVYRLFLIGYGRMVIVRSAMSYFNGSNPSISASTVVPLLFLILTV
jgi:hypothetical protein